MTDQRWGWLSLAGVLLICAEAWASPAPITVGKARFTVLTPQVIRMEYSPTRRFVDEPSLFASHRDVRLMPQELAKIHIQASAHDLRIDTGWIVLTYHDDGKPFACENLHADIRWNPDSASTDATSSWCFGEPSRGNLGGTLHRLDYVSHAVPLPDGLLSRDGWYYLDDSKSFLMSPDFQNGWVKLRDPATDQSDGFLFGYGLNFRSALQSLTRVSGSVPLPRKYALGAWYSRWWPYTSNDYREIVREFHEHDFPLDMLVMDMDWHRAGWTGYSWNRKLLPDGDALLAELHQKDGLHVTLNDHPQEGVKPIEDMYAAFMRALGLDPSTKQTVKYDAGNRRYIKTLLRMTHTPLERKGVDFWWLDWMGDDQSPYNKLPWMNELYYRHSETSIPEKNLRGMSFSRWAGWGDQRHPIQFSGDVPIAWSSLQFEIQFTSTANNVGAFYWSHDIGGFINSNPFQKIGELLARWTQFGATSATLRLHSANKFWLDKRPWKWSKQVEESMRISFHLRSKLFPYVYSAAWESHVTSVGFDRPLYMDYPMVPEAYENPQEYLWGDAFLVAPITSPGSGPNKVATQKIWLPEGRWYDWFSGLETAGDSIGTVARDLNTFPLFARGGIPIVMQPYSERMATTPLSHLIVRVYPGVPNQTLSSELYEDDGETQAYLHGQSALTKLTYFQSPTEAFLRISPTQGHFQGQLSSRSYEIQLASFGSPLQAWVNGTPVPVRFDSAKDRNLIEIPTMSVNQGLVIRVQMPPTFR